MLVSLSPANSDIEYTMYVLNVDLWSEDALKEVNLVRHTTATPSISSTSPASYAQIEQATPAYSHILPSSRDMGYPQQMAYPPPGQAVSPYGMQQPYSQGRLPLTSATKQERTHLEDTSVTENSR